MLDNSQIEALIHTIRSFGMDTQICEVKASAAGFPKNAVETLSAFANGSGGTMILGLSEASGFKPADGFDAGEMQDALANACANKLTPPIRPDINITTFEGSSIVVAEIPETEPVAKPCYITDRGLYNGSFIRTGDGDRKLSAYEVNRLVENHRQPRYDLEVIEESTPDDLDSELVSGLLQRERAAHERVFAKLDDVHALRNLRVIVEDDAGVLRCTLAGIMALGFHPQKFFPRLCVSFTHYPGHDKRGLRGERRRFLDSATLIGPIPYMLDDAVSAVRRNMRVGSVIEGAFRHDVPDYPEAAIREAVANALMHRDYSPESRGTPVQIDMYDDRLEVISPGGLYGGVTVDLIGRPGVLATRNEYLAGLLESTPYKETGMPAGFVVENRGTGYSKILESLEELQMYPPLLKDSPTLFSIIFMRQDAYWKGTSGKRRNASARFPTASGDTRTTPSSDNPDGHGKGESIRYGIVALMEEHGEISATELMDYSGLSRATISRYLRDMVDEGIIEPTAPVTDRRRRYHLAG